jgi:nucleoside-diphosphate kinase
MKHISRELAERHYDVHKGKPFYEALIQYITSGPVIVGCVSGPSAIEVVRGMLGATDGRKAQPGTVRGDFSLSVQFNLVHGSDSHESAKKEIGLFFTPDEILDYPLDDETWIIDKQ